MVAVVKELGDAIEGNQIGSKNYRFVRIGESLAIQSDDNDSNSSVYDPDNPPAQPLAVSERHGLLFIAHSTGFYVVRTRDVIDSSKKTEGRGSIHELSVVDVPIGKVSILALSADSSTLAVWVDGTADLHFYSVTGLLNKEQTPTFSCSVEDSSGIKDIRWTKNLEQNLLVLSKNGNLYHGSGEDHLKYVTDNVDSVEWSMRGEFVALARSKVISILSSNFDETLSMSLSLKSSIGDSDVNSSIKVDSIRWVRPDCIILGCFQLTPDGTEEGYLIQVITSQEGEITNASSPVVISFNDVFLGFIDDAVPFASSPHMFLSYLDQCELAFIANRKNVDQHIVLFGWSTDDNKEAALIEILNDAWTPRIDCQGNGEDNIVIGLSVDNVSQDKQAKINFDEDNEVFPCCVFMCLTVDGRLTVFHFASAIGKLAQQDAICTISDKDEDIPLPVPAAYQLPEVRSNDDEQKRGAEEAKETATLVKSVQANTAQIISHDDYTGKKEKVKQVLDPQTINRQEQAATPFVKFSHDDMGQLSKSPGQQGGTLKPSVFTVSNPDSSKAVVRDLRNTEYQTTAEFTSNTYASPEKPKTGMSDHAAHSDMPKGFGSNLALPAQTVETTVQYASHKLSGGPSSSSRPAEGRFLKSPSSMVQMHQSDGKNTIPGYAQGQPQNILHAKDFVGSFNFTKNKPLAVEGSIKSSPEPRSSQVHSREKYTSEKSPNSAATAGSFRASSSIGLLSSGPNMSKQFLSVEEMAKELDVLLEHIEGNGGFSDAYMSLQKNSVVALEEGIWALSERCRNWKGIMNEGLAKIQLILDKTVQVLARKIYMEGIVKQATDSRYWDLWNHQKLSSELEIKRRHLLELNQDLTNQLIDLEKHFNSLEFNNFCGSAGSQMTPKTIHNKHGSSRYLNSLNSLQNTMSAQLAAAEQLSKHLSKQMAVLSIESPSVKKQNVKRDLFETIGIPYDDASFISPDEKKGSNFSLKHNRLSLSSSLAARENSWRKELSTIKGSEPETARRRRDSLDRNWSSFNPPKTTVKRMFLQDNRQSPKTGTASLMTDKQLFNHEMGRSAYIVPEPSYPSSATISNSSKVKVTRSAPTSGSSGIASTWLSKTDELHTPMQPTENFLPLPSQSTANLGSGLNHSAIHESKSIKRSEIHHKKPVFSTRFPAENLPYLKKTDTEKQAGLSGLTSGNYKQEPIATDSFFSDKSRKSQPPPLLSSSSAPSLSDSGTGKSSFSQFVAASSSMSMSYTSSGSNAVTNLSPFPPNPTSPNLTSVAVPSGSLTNNSDASVQTVPVPSSPPSENSVTSTIMPSLNSTSKTPGTEVVKSSIETDKKSEVLTATSPSGLQIDGSNLKLEPPFPSKPTHEVSTSSQSGTQFSFSVSNAVTKQIPEQPSLAPILSSASLSGPATVNNQKIGNSDVVYIQEDEMEEEAPEESRSTGLTLGRLSGFGIGSTPNPTASKSNPFGASFASTSSPPNSSFSMAIPGGEFFQPASFSFPSPSPSQPSQPSNYASFAGGLGSGTTLQVPPGGFGHPAQTGAGQQALGSVLGSFGQSRQIGAGLPGTSVASAGGFGGNQSVGGFAGNQSTGGFSNAAAGGGFASLASAGGGFSGIASAGSGISGGGFSGFGAAATSGGGFGAAAASGGGGFGAAAASGGGGFGAVSPSGGGGFGAAAASGGGGFGAIAPSGGGGFGAIAPSGGGGFGAAAASGGGGFGAAAPSGGGGGFGAAAASGGGGFGAAASGTFPTTGGGFGGSSNQGNGFSSFGGGGGSVRPPPNLLTQMRK